jgi:hypothetical protein
VYIALLCIVPLKDKLLGWFTNFCNVHLCPCMNFPLFETIYFNKHVQLTYLFQAQPRTAIQSALTNSDYYLRNQQLDLTIPPNKNQK